MIKNIQRIKNFGIFKDCNNSGVQDFGKLNLIYGWNGSGKSTLSVLFESLEKKSVPDTKYFPFAEFTVNCHNDTIITNKNIKSTNLNIFTFNENFIKENIDWNNSIKSILLVAKGKIEERKELDSHNNLQEKENASRSQEEKEKIKLTEDISKFISSSAKRTKTSFQVIDTSDSRYFNYNKTKLDNFINANKIELIKDSAILSDEKVVELTSGAKPDKKQTIRIQISPIKKSTFINAKKRLDDLLKTSTVGKTIDRLTQNAKLQTWVLNGSELHKKYASESCEFCGNKITDERLSEIEVHFSDEYKGFKQRLSKANEWLENQYVKVGGLPSEDSFYDELKKEFTSASEKMDAASKVVNDEIYKWHEILKKKIENQFDTSLVVDKINESYITFCNEKMDEVKKIIKKHNDKTNNFDLETKKIKHQLELHYAAKEIKDYEYFEKQKYILEKSEIISKLTASINSRKESIKKLEESLSNESLGAKQFNDSLHKFMGRGDLSLKFNEIIGGYEIVRNDEGAHDSNLSEGERSAIAFVYFITKLTENNNRISSSIVVVDDPVSSFDSNYLFHAYSFLRNNCKNTKQLIVLTHNFTFYKLVRDWLNGNNTNRKQRKQPKDPNAFFYTIESEATLPRRSSLKNADATLIDYESEYHYLFSRLYHYKESTKLKRDEAFLTANLARKLLESFFTFKYPRSRSDLSQLMSSGIKGCTITDENTKEKIYRFINKYSHSNVIETNEDFSENLLGESSSVIGDIFVWIEEVDKIHYDEMIEVVVTLFSRRCHIFDYESKLHR